MRRPAGFTPLPNRTKQPSMSMARPKRTDSDVLAVRNGSARWRCPNCVLTAPRAHNKRFDILHSYSGSRRVSSDWWRACGRPVNAADRTEPAGDLPGTRQIPWSKLKSRFLCMPTCCVVCSVMVVHGWSSFGDELTVVSVPEVSGKPQLNKKVMITPYTAT
jgi:hypothetical protein